MNVKAVIAALQALEGHHILILANTQPHACLRRQGFVHGQPCHRVQDLPPDQRQELNQGNVILSDGYFTPEGLQAGITFWAKDIRSITWGHDHIVAHIHTNTGTKISIIIIKQWKISEEQRNVG